MGQLQPLLHRQDPGSQPNLTFFHVVHGSLLESQPQDVQPNQGGDHKFHLGR